MHIENTTEMTGDWSQLWEYASQIEKWPGWLPHYRKVTVESVSPDGLEKRGYMAAWRDILPVSWHTIQRLQPSGDPAQARVLYQHVKGVTKGMQVVWLFEPQGTGRYRVTITHDWTPGWPLVGGLASGLISRLIVSNIADKTLARFRELQERSGVRGQGSGIRSQEI